MAVVCTQNAFLTSENEHEIASLHAVARGNKRAKTVGNCLRGKPALLEDEENATVDRARVALASSKLLLHSENMPEFVYFKTAHDTFLTACSAGMLYCEQPQCLDWMKFRIIDHRDGTVSILNYLGKFLRANQQGLVMCDRQAIGDNETWTWERLDNGKFTLRGFHKKYLSAKAFGTVKADVHDANGAKSPGMGWESFEIIPHTESIQACEQNPCVRLVASDQGRLAGDGKNSFCNNLGGYRVASRGKTSNMSSKKDAQQEHKNDSKKESLPKDSVEQQSNSYSRSLVPKDSDFADSFSTTDGESTKQQNESDSADHFLTIDGDSTEQQNDSSGRSHVPRHEDFADSSSTAIEQESNSYGHSLVPKNRNCANSLSSTDAERPTASW